MLVLSLTHILPCVINHTHKGNMGHMWRLYPSYWTGMTAELFLAVLTIISFGVFRRRFYTLYHTLYKISALMILIFLFIHVNFRLSSWDYIIASFVLVSLPTLYSTFRTLLIYGAHHQAFVTPLPGGMLRIQIPVRSAAKIGLRMAWYPTQHIFLRFQTMRLDAMTSHPFNVCSLGPSKHRDERCELVFFVRPKRLGFTKRLAKKAAKNPGTAVPVLLDGPYGGMTVKTLSGFDRAVIIAGGAQGAGYVLPVIEDILHRKDFESNEGPGRVTRIQVIVATRSLETRDWFSLEMQRLLYRYSSAEFLKVEMHITGGGHGGRDKVVYFDDWTIRANTSIAAALQVREGRPDIRKIVEVATITPFETVGIVACGPPELIWDVSNGAASAQWRVLTGQHSGEIFLHTEIVR
jgi:hypothetical protein